MKMGIWRIAKVFQILGVLGVVAVTSNSRAQVIGINVTIAPPELPVYEQPAIPDTGYIWSPGYWAYGEDGYFWVPGTWVLPPAVGLLWTPGYWVWRDGLYVWNAGYWGEHVGFYGGVNYGYGYGGLGYEGGYWNHGTFAYNRTVNNFGSVNIVNVYSRTVITNTNVTRVSFNGGSGGIAARPTPQELAVAHEQHTAATPVQTQHQQMASTNPALRATNNHGQPAIAATARPAEFSGKGVVAAKSAPPTPVPGPTSAGVKPATLAPASNRPVAARPATSPAVRNQAALPGANAPKSPVKPAAAEVKPRAAPQVQAARPVSAPPHVAAAPRAPTRVASAPHPAAPRPAPGRAPAPKPKKPQ
jgi:WXXGXW repeat (2 copies)